jgi:hypothetical protein
MDLKIEIAGVKVMRSFDYCHFEVTLSASLSDLTEEQDRVKAVDELRKQAARLADKAVEQYKIAKENARLCGNDPFNLERLKREALQAEARPESERTPEEMAALKYLSDSYYQNRRRYNYEDDFREPDWAEDNSGD